MKVKITANKKINRKKKGNQKISIYQINNSIFWKTLEELGYVRTIQPKLYNEKAFSIEMDSEFSRKNPISNRAFDENEEIPIMKFVYDVDKKYFERFSSLSIEDEDRNKKGNSDLKGFMYIGMPIANWTAELMFNRAIEDLATILKSIRGNIWYVPLLETEIKSGRKTVQCTFDKLMCYKGDYSKDIFYNMTFQSKIENIVLTKGKTYTGNTSKITDSEYNKGKVEILEMYVNTKGFL